MSVSYVTSIRSSVLLHFLEALQNDIVQASRPDRLVDPRVVYPHARREAVRRHGLGRSQVLLAQERDAEILPDEAVHAPRGLGDVRRRVGRGVLPALDLYGAQVERLAQRQEVRRGDLGQHVNRLERVPGRYERQGVEGLVAHLGRLDVRSDGVGQEAQLRGQAGDDDVKPLEQERVVGVVRAQVGRQAPAGSRVDHLGALGEQHAADTL